ncbi:biogenesis of lysosome-related organelles complex 1 subunit 1 [Quercus robur]|uniref:biogenesis of lysosome-related organelles complex 1 subunit 1 n=1 Tax=Quercus robur TaxID=38942 RepID=UPI002162579B|nr:biogenesis of lysosome-related organelles complex 1 subunit 1 [Quercus robur]XP_050276863.1 biogenesis of lysosome-related organelles complex 1 subunit 1 [Quercus robur]XP_050276864.1 biogenesis of lysosome-related organelles complex 1 subunit 1 [Quercus robur]XP_050276865.1 biogenesis of lysosome-related organelles complex 1 subunit 1 [Quercus robur]
MYSPQLPLARGRVPSSSPSSSFSFDAQHADPGGLEAALLQIMHDHHHTSLRLRDQAERAKKDAIQNAVRVSDLLVDAVNSGVQESFINEKRIEHEIRALAVTIARFMKQTNQWLTATRAINTAVKEIGDFENWMKTMEFDCKSITAAIQNIHQA